MYNVGKNMQRDIKFIRASSTSICNLLGVVLEQEGRRDEPLLCTEIKNREKQNLRICRKDRLAATT